MATVISRLFNVSLRGQSPLATIPFFVKLPICLAADGIGLLFLMAWVIPLVGLPGTIGYAVFQALVAYAFWNSPMLAVLVFGVEAAPFLNVLPMLTLMCVWNGYKTGWRF